jgi:hypothetical protein
VILILSFGVGHLVQELGDKVIKALTGPRFFRQGRDNFWVTEEAKHLRKSLAEDLGHPVVSADHGFDCCLTMIEERFAKRDVFLATSDLCRSFLVLAFLAILPGVRVIKSFSHSKTATIESLAALIGLVLIVSWLSWGRMIRFRELSELTVFRVYAGSRTKKPNTKTADNYQSADRREE